MIYRIIGRSGSGKTAYILEGAKKAYSEGKECIFLTPEQQSISTEKALCALLGSGYNLNIEILNFERLPDRVFRENGGVALSRADSKTLSLFTALACENAKDKLTLYPDAALDKDFTKKISSSLEKMGACGVTPPALVNAASLIGNENSSFKEKLYDIAQIYYDYTEILKKGYEDSAGVQKKLYESLKENNFFKGKTVFIDGYYNFTKAQYPIVDMIFRGADDTYITVLYDEDEKSGIFDINKETLLLTEKSAQGIKDIYPDESRERTESLSFLEKNLFSQTKAVCPQDDSISVISCKTPYEESDCIAREIIKLVKNGYRYKDICVAMRDNGRLEGFLDSALNRFGIPFYMADKEELSSMELSALVLSLLEIAYTDWSTASVIRYATSSFSPLTRKEADLLSIYAESWKIRGNRWHNGEEWLMNPSGYKTSLTKRDEEMLSVVNSAREKLLFALEAYVTDLKSKNLTISKGVRAIYNHLIHIESDKMLEKRAEKLLESGKEDEAAKISALWDSIMSILNTLYETAGNQKVTAKRLYDLIRLMMDEYKLGSLPTYSDSIEVGNASIMRPSECKVMIVTGMNDGVFPASPAASGLFSNSEKEFLNSVGIESETLPEAFMKNEFLLFYNLCAAPSEKLILTYSENSASGEKARISMFADSVMRIAGKSCFSKYIQPKAKKISSSKDKNIDTFFEKVSLSPIEPYTLRLSASRIETYLKCPFSYYCKYILALEKYEKATFNPADTGTYYHSILEDFTKSLFETGSFKSKTPDEIKAFIDSAKEKYEEKIFYGKSNEREKYSFDKHNKVLFPLLSNINDEFSSSGFVPLDYESKTTSIYPITEKTKAKLSGFADRIDVFEKDGKKYIRIIDYKTGKRTLSENDVKNGFEMQMFTYLFSACQNGEIPAGVMYFNCGMPSKDDTPFQRKGIMLDDDAIKQEMSFLVDNKQFGKKSFKSSEVFEELKTAVAENIKKTGKRIIDGKMDIEPKTIKSKNPCSFCNAKLYCRKRLTEDEND
jgi:ATP-dependent helicase/nuclease subunit B